jgi:hypothetical protein
MTSLTKTKLLVYLVGIFVAGAVSGGFVGYNVRLEHPGPPKRPPGPEHWIAMIRERFAEDVGVTDEQWDSKIGPIITNSVREIGELDARNRERIGEMITRSDAQVMDLLTPEQKPRMQKMIEDRQKHWHGSPRGDKGPRGPGEKREKNGPPSPKPQPENP